MQECKLLIFDDDPSISELVTYWATQTGFTARAAGSYKEILKLLDTFLPDIIVLDILMPEIDGFEIMQLLSQRKSKTRIIIISARDDYLEIAKGLASALNLQIAAVVAKPLNPTAFKVLLEKLKPFGENKAEN